MTQHNWPCKSSGTDSNRSSVSPAEPSNFSCRLPDVPCGLTGPHSHFRQSISAGWTNPDYDGPAKPLLRHTELFISAHPVWPRFQALDVDATSKNKANHACTSTPNPPKYFPATRPTKQLPLTSMGVITQTQKNEPFLKNLRQKRSVSPSLMSFFVSKQCDLTLLTTICSWSWSFELRFLQSRVPWALWITYTPFLTGQIQILRLFVATLHRHRNRSAW